MGPNAQGDRAPQGTTDGLPKHPRSGQIEGEGHQLELHRGSESDSARIADLHTQQISEGFLSYLGPRFLRRLYRRIMRDPESFVLVADHRGLVVGFIAGSTDVAGLYRRFLRRDGLLAALSAAPRLILRWRRVLETLGHGAGGSEGAQSGTELLSVAVSPDYRGQGVGGLLVGAFLDEVVARTGSTAHVVVGEDNAQAVALYRRNGFATSRRFELHPGTVSLVMQWERPSSAPRPGSEPL